MAECPPADSRVHCPFFSASVIGICTAIVAVAVAVAVGSSSAAPGEGYPLRRCVFRSCCNHDRIVAPAAASPSPPGPPSDASRLLGEEACYGRRMHGWPRLGFSLRRPGWPLRVLLLGGPGQVNQIGEQRGPGQGHLPTQGPAGGRASTRPRCGPEPSSGTRCHAGPSLRRRPPRVRIRAAVCWWEGAGVESGVARGGLRVGHCGTPLCCRHAAGEGWGAGGRTGRRGFGARVSRTAAAAEAVSSSALEQGCGRPERGSLQLRPPHG